MVINFNDFVRDTEAVVHQAGGSCSSRVRELSKRARADEGWLPTRMRR